MFIGICAGSAMLSSQFREAGVECLAIDRHQNRFHPLAPICVLDLTKKHSWEFLEQVIERYHVILVHAAPPCGTCWKFPCPVFAHSRFETRSIPWAFQVFLRKIRPGLTQPILSMFKCPSSFTDFDACAWGSKCETHKPFLSSLPQMSQLEASCPGNHERMPYGRKRNSDGQVVYVGVQSCRTCQAVPQHVTFRHHSLAQNAFECKGVCRRAKTTSPPRCAAHSA